MCSVFLTGHHPYTACCVLANFNNCSILFLLCQISEKQVVHSLDSSGIASVKELSGADVSYCSYYYYAVIMAVAIAGAAAVAAAIAAAAAVAAAVAVAVAVPVLSPEVPQSVLHLAVTGVCGVRDAGKGE